MEPRSELKSVFVSELCHMPPETPLKHRDLREQSDADSCCVKSLIGSALVGIRVRQHPRRESISKRTPSSAFARVRCIASYCEMSRRSGVAAEEDNHSDISPL
jgi:hypothetical protein